MPDAITAAVPEMDGPINTSEEADDYHAVVARLGDGWRIVSCKAGIQWILQRSAGERHGRTRWDGRSFCRTKEALTRLCRTLSIDPAARQIMDALPDRFPDKQAGVARRSIPGAITSTIIAGPPGIAVGSNYYNEHGGVEGTANDLRRRPVPKTRNAQQAEAA